jgi:hypothetical protein
MFPLHFTTELLTSRPGEWIYYDVDDVLLFMCALITFACEPVDSTERRRRQGNGRRTANAQLAASSRLIRPNFPLQNRVSMVKH